MLEMHKKINKREILVGWYSFCNKIMKSDSCINKIFSSYSKKPLFILLWVDTLVNGLVIEAYSTKKSNSDRFDVFKREKITIGMLESEDIAVNQILIDSKAWSKNFRSSIFTDWFQIFTSFSKFFRKQYKQKIVLKNYKQLRTNLFLKKEFRESFRNFQFKKNDFNSDLILLYFLNIVKLVIRLDNSLFRVIL